MYCQDWEKVCWLLELIVLVLGRDLTVRPGKPKMKRDFVSGLRLRFPLDSGSEVALQAGKGWAPVLMRLLVG